MSLSTNAIVRGKQNKEKSGKRGGFTLPGYNYLGPGNSIFDGDEVDEADLVAKIHDIDYSRATSFDDIRRADEEAINSFREAGGIAGYIGYEGIKDKYALESVTGVLYPNTVMSRRHLGRELYAARERAIMHEWRIDFKNRGVSYADFKRLPIVRSIRARFNKGGEEYRRLAAEINGSNTNAGPSGSEQRGDDEDFDWDEFDADFNNAIAGDNVGSDNINGMEVEQSTVE